MLSPALVELRLPPPRSVAALYGVVSLAFSVLLVSLSLRRDARELALWLIPYAALLLVCLLGAEWGWRRKRPIP